MLIRKRRAEYEIDPPTPRVEAFGGLERDRSASENRTIALSDVYVV